jgi:hypothetical protein
MGDFRQRVRSTSELRNECEAADVWPAYGQEKYVELLHVSRTADPSGPSRGSPPQWLGGMQRQISFAGDRIPAGWAAILVR